MNKPKDVNDLLRHLNCGTVTPETLLNTEDEQHLTMMVGEIRQCKPAVVIVETDGVLKYMFSNATRGEAISIMGKVIECNGKRTT